jgi:hypothetical protein
MNFPSKMFFTGRAERILRPTAAPVASVVCRRPLLLPKHQLLEDGQVRPRAGVGRRAAQYSTAQIQVQVQIQHST